MEPKINEPIRQGNSTPVKCWMCGADHYLSSCPEKNNKDSLVYNLNKVSTVRDVARNIPRIYVALENRQADHQSSMI